MAVTDIRIDTMVIVLMQGSMVISAVVIRAAIAADIITGDEKDSSELYRECAMAKV